LKRPVRLSQLTLAVWVGVWLLVLPLRLRHYSLPGLLERCTAAARGRPSRSPQEMDHAVRMVVKICHLRCFRWSVFPRACLRQALAMYYVLTWLGVPVTIHFGVHKAGASLHGHSWVTVRGTPVAERTHPAVFHCVYSYPAASSWARRDARGLSSQTGQPV
jgi:hypothetical protein